jgi:hypothetical protein
MTRQREHVKDRRKLGFCAYEGCPVKTGAKYRCPDHAAAHAAAKKAAYWAKREQQQRAA